MPTSKSSAKDPARAADLAVGPGPRWFRRTLVGLACLYLVALVKHPPDTKITRPMAFFTEATCLFPRAADFAIEYRLEVWSCNGRWEQIDPRPYFPIQPDDKESRLQRLAYFYDRSREAMHALDAYISAAHLAGADDGVSGPIGGIQLVKVVRKEPAPGEPVERYRFDPLAPVPADQRREMFRTVRSERTKRCQAQGQPTAPASGSPPETPPQTPAQTPAQVESEVMHDE